MLPDFKAVGVAGVMEIGVGSDEFGGDPGGTAVGDNRPAFANDLLERLVDRDLERFAAQKAEKAARGVESIEFNDGARIGRPPGDGVNRPGKGAGPIGGEQGGDVQLAPDVHEVFVDVGEMLFSRGLGSFSGAAEHRLICHPGRF